MSEIVLRYTEPLLRQVVRSFVLRAVFRQLGVRFFVVLAAVTAAVAYLLALQDRSVLLGFVVATLLNLGFFFGAIYVGHYRNIVGRFRKMKSGQATLSYDEKQITVTSELGSSTIAWSAITDVWRFPRFWLLLLSPSQFITLPLDCLDSAEREFILRKVGRSN